MTDLQGLAPAKRIHIIGGSGVGTSTLARSMASLLKSQAFDTDDFYWHPTDPPFSQKRSVAERLDLMEQTFLPRRDWVLSGGLASWGSSLQHRFTHVILMTLDPEVRLARLRHRERLRYGTAIEEGGVMEAGYRAFMCWASGYDHTHFRGRSIARHRRWLDALDCPVFELDASAPPDQLALTALDLVTQAPERKSVPLGATQRLRRLG
ncbi:hypothetical protein AQS8620_01106 [Aquimixticola soesokkakensis]|uniref:Topology modulation protein n=1 Tax=Aquimixticola soesokkakensis TaxID=1519096 RepID=A0A1Y5S943_9RHOB|nr:AAA family ATPase [Aquimixticola soesokkakensis]SLN32833.1 hypothetical protein AQS8620_01106 [Aquimixticola soesokkakensis]